MVPGVYDSLREAQVSSFFRSLFAHLTLLMTVMWWFALEPTFGAFWKIPLLNYVNTDGLVAEGKMSPHVVPPSHYGHAALWDGALHVGVFVRFSDDVVDQSGI